MLFLNQVIELLSRYPGSLIYHFGILFAIEATLGIAVAYRQRPAVRRVMLAAGGTLLGRLALMAIALLDLQGLIPNPSTVIPPLERAMDTIGVWLLIWALLPLFDNLPHWGNLLAGGVSLLLLALYFVFAFSWYAEGAGRGYNTSLHETAWEVIQLGMLGAAAVRTLFKPRGDWGLRLGILLVLLAAHGIHFGWALPGENVAGWVRLGQLIAYPLLAVSAYRLVLGSLMAEAERTPTRPPVELLERIRQLGAMSISVDQASVTPAAVTAIAAFTGADTVALMMLAAEQAENRVDMVLASACTEGQLFSRPERVFNLDDAPALRRVINRKQALFLRPVGMDDPSRLSLLMYLLPDVSLKTRLESPLLIQPVHRGNQLFGALLVVWHGPTGGEIERLADNRRLIDLLATQLAAALAQARSSRRLQERATRLDEQLGQLETDTNDRLEQLQSNLEQAQHSKREQARRLDAAQQEVIHAQRRTQELAALLDERSARPKDLAALARLNDDLQGQMDELTAELEQARVAAVAGREVEQAPAWRGADQEQINLLTQELRRPMASITGYTDLLLSGSVGKVGELQSLFLRRVKASSERARVLLDDLVQMVAFGDGALAQDLEPVNMVETIADVVLKFGERLGEKGIDLQVDLDHSTPLLNLDQDGLDQIMYHLLSNALQATPPNGRASIEARFQQDSTADGSDPKQGYLFIAVNDSGGGIALADQSQVFERHYRAKHTKIAGLGDAGVGMPLVKDLVESYGGRVWVESELDKGSTFSLVLPVTQVQR